MHALSQPGACSGPTWMKQEFPPEAEDSLPTFSSLNQFVITGLWPCFSASLPLADLWNLYEELLWAASLWVPAPLSLG